MLHAHTTPHCPDSTTERDSVTNQKLEGYRCSECNRLIGLMADKNGSAQIFRCPNTGRLAERQMPLKRDTKPHKEPSQTPVERNGIAHSGNGSRDAS
jgi:hypothetical protein